MKKISVIGAGYVGLVTGVCLADLGNEVICVDIKPEVIEKLNRGEVHFYEPGLSAIMKENIERKRLVFTTNLKDAVEKSEIIFIAVGTPQGPDGSADISHVITAVHGIADCINNDKILVMKSTVPVGTCKAVQHVFDKKSKFEVSVVSNPEYLKEGDAVRDFRRPDRIILGGVDSKAIEAMKALYSPFVKNGHPIFVMNWESSELTKYAANCMLATRISFMNELSRFCEKTGANIDDVRKGIGSDSRIGQSFLYAGVGYGGSCFPKDVSSLIHQAQFHGAPLKIIEATRDANEKQKQLLLQKAISHFGDLKGKTFAIWGLTYKPETDDVRDAPSISIINSLLAENAAVTAYDPKVSPTIRNEIKGNITYLNDKYDALKNADALILITEWNEFKEPDFNQISKLLKNKVIFDGRNIYNKDELIKLGFTYYGVGK